VSQELIFRLAHGQRRHGRRTSHYDTRSWTLLVGGLLKKWVMAVKVLCHGEIDPNHIVSPTLVRPVGPFTVIESSIQTNEYSKPDTALV
jgi:hypothetical protein